MARTANDLREDACLSCWGIRPKDKEELCAQFQPF